MAEEEKKKKRLPTALKRRKQDDKKHLRNKVFKSKIHTARVRFEKEQDPETKSGLLSSIFSLVDKAVKRGIFKRNKADRIKSRYHARVS